ncbi:hypothetical protein FLONG3_7203 [Fusarium longipes]|uniref:Azaphilone pigments biosynthesis cluster protein L N-terminal domain-containing protein n=1 Tax=Fusarium longipes TaxID=694270 RepID=A0A395SFN5_9HYPO|nr:hypothetical protein FLONG3_7203 [Fusarium longipes]
MAELALAIVPLGITATSGLVKYLKSFKDHHDDHARLILQAERFRSIFQSLETVLKRSQLSPEVSSSVSEASACLQECQKALNELDTLQQNIFSSTTSAVATISQTRAKGKIKDGYKKLLYPLRKSDVENLEGALNKLSTTLGLALEMLHLDEEYLTRNLLNQHMADIQLTTSTAIEELCQPLSQMGSTLPVLQTSVDAIIPHFNQRIDQLSNQQLQIQAQINSFLVMSGATRNQDLLGTNQQVSYDHLRKQANYPTARERELEQGSLTTTAESALSCSCHLQRVRKRKGYALGPVYFAEETLFNFYHEKDCSFYITSSSYEKTWTMRFTGLPSLLKKCLEVSLSSRARAGGFSISPSFTYFPVVDEDVAPAWLVINLMRKASLVRFLVAAGTSVTVRDCVGALALHSVIDGTFVPASIYGQLIAGNDIDDGAISYRTYWAARRELLDYYNHNLSVARIQYGPLSLAVIQNNLLEVERLISLYPHMFREISVYGETPLHIAIFRPEILKALVKMAKPEDWIRYDFNFATILYLATQFSHEICDPGDTLDYTSCSCTLPLRIILAAGCPIIPHRDFRHGYNTLTLDGSFSKASSHCKTLLAQELRSRRRQLRDLARRKLSITEFSILKGMEDVPDVDAIEIDRLLRQKGILGLGPLSTFADEDLPQQPYQDVEYYSRSIFFDLKTPKDADLFLDSGFSMICTDQDQDSSVDRSFFGTNSLWIRSVSLDYAMWLIDHQAALWKWSYRFTSPMPSIFVLADILGMQDCKYPGQDDISHRAEAYLSKSFSVDDCSCLCSPDGCTPFASRMKWLAHPQEPFEELTLQAYATRFRSHVKMYGRSLSMSQHVIMMRQATFAALGHRHTCVDRPGCFLYLFDGDDMIYLDLATELDSDEIQFEISNIDAEARKQLEEMVVMFQDFVLTGRKTTISNESDSFQLHYEEHNESSTLCVNEVQYRRVLKFWKHIWRKRMQIALDTVAESWGNKLDGSDNGIQILTCEEIVQETGGSDEEGDEERFNRIIQRIQDM